MSISYPIFLNFFELEYRYSQKKMNTNRKNKEIGWKGKYSYEDLQLIIKLNNLRRMITKDIEKEKL